MIYLDKKRSDLKQGHKKKVYLEIFFFRSSKVDHKRLPYFTPFFNRDFFLLPKKPVGLKSIDARFRRATSTVLAASLKRVPPAWSVRTAVRMVSQGVETGGGGAVGSTQQVTK